MTLCDIYEKSKVFVQAEGGEMRKESASLFVCGTILKEIFCPSMQLLYPGTEYSTEQLWYLLCLYHDRRFETRTFWKYMCQYRASQINKNKGEAENIRISSDWKPMGNMHIPMFSFGKEGVRFTENVCVRESAIKEGKVKDQFFFRTVCSKEEGMDHGIAGGLFLYENLLCRHDQQMGKIKKDAMHLCSYLSNTLMVHNIVKEAGEASLDKNPFLFLLLLAEAIEPFHYMQQERDEVDVNILKMIEVKIREKEFIIRPDIETFPVKNYFHHIQAAVKKTGMWCNINDEVSEICIKMCESAIIDELFI